MVAGYGIGTSAENIVPGTSSKEYEPPVTEMYRIYEMQNERLMRELSNLEETLKPVLAPGYFELECDGAEIKEEGQWCSLAMSLKEQNEFMRNSINKVVRLRELAQF